MFILLTLACSSLEPQTKTIVMDVLGPLDLGEEDVRIFEVGPVDSTSIVTPFGPEILEEDGEEAVLEHPIDQEATLFFVDLAPEGRWAHPASWVWLTGDGELLQEEIHDWFPVVDNEPFLPYDHEPIWGVPQDDTPPTIDAEEAPADDRGTPPPPTHDVTCPEEPVDVSYSFTGWGASGTSVDVSTMHTYFRDIAEYRAYSMHASTGTPAAREADIMGWMDLLIANEKNVGELAIFYAGHGTQGGNWSMGHRDAATALITPTELAAKVMEVNPDSVTLVIDACFAQTFGQKFATAMARTGLRPDVRVLAASSPTESSGGGSGGGKYTNALSNQYLGQWAEPLWENVSISPIAWESQKDVVYTYPDGRKIVLTVKQPRIQTASNTLTPFTIARVLRGEEPTVAQVCTAADLETQDYSRELRIEGERFGDMTGQLFAQDINGGWVPLEVVFWADENVVFHMPMRRDGFPSDGSSRDAAPQVPGVYLVEVINQAGTSEPTPVLVRAQEYTQTYTPTSQTDWAELWHPMTPQFIWTVGATIQQSNLRLTAELPPSYTPADGNALHETSPGMSALPGWGFELLPADRDLQTANDQSFPTFRYYGFRVVFADTFTPNGSWDYTLVYD